MSTKIKCLRVEGLLGEGPEIRDRQCMVLQRVFNPRQCGIYILYSLFRKQANETLLKELPA